MEEMGWEQDGCALHDAVAAAYLVDDTLFQTRQTGIEVEMMDPHSRGLTRFTPATENRTSINVITGLDTVKCRDLIWSHIEQ